MWNYWRILFFVILWNSLGESLEIRNRTCPKEYVAGRNDLDLNYLQETPIVFVFDFDLDKKNLDAFVTFYDNITCLLPDDTSIYSVFVGNNFVYSWGPENNMNSSFRYQLDETIEEHQKMKSEHKYACELFDKAVIAFSRRYETFNLTTSLPLIVVGQVNFNESNVRRCDIENIKENVRTIDGEKFIFNLLNIGERESTNIEQTCEDIKRDNSVTFGSQVDFQKVGLMEYPDATIRRSKEFVKNMNLKVGNYTNCFKDERSYPDVTERTERADQNNNNDTNVNLPQPVSSTRKASGHILIIYLPYIALGIVLMLLVIVIIISLVDKKFWTRRETHGERRNLEKRQSVMPVNQDDPEEGLKKDKTNRDTSDVVYLGEKKEVEEKLRNQTAEDKN